MNDIIVDIFCKLRGHFFDTALNPIPFHLRPKINTQDDPLDEYITKEILSKLSGGIKCERSGSLTSPDAVIYSQDASQLHPIQLDNNIKKMVGLEIKKVGRRNNGTLARLNTIDFNSTPPCGTILVYSNLDESMPIRCFYLFVCLEKSKKNVFISSLSLVDGDLLNDDFDFYLSIVGEREKTISLGSYGDGINRSRPMLVFPNPLSISVFDRNATLIHYDTNIHGMSKIATINRLNVSGTNKQFTCYCAKGDSKLSEIINLGDPFTVPKNRSIRTNQRGKFKISF